MGSSVFFSNLFAQDVEEDALKIAHSLNQFYKKTVIKIFSCLARAGKYAARTNEVRKLSPCFKTIET